MISVQKITNKDSSFLISYWSGSKQETVLVDETNIVEEMNKSFAAIEENNKKQMEREAAYRNQCVSGGLLGSVGSATANDVRAA